jgi:signal transduction histidine kinase/DNA-binding response OmpR family regulator
MNEYLNRQLDQISKLISSLKGEEVDLDRLSQLNHSLEVLSQQIKTSRIGSRANRVKDGNQTEKQDAAFFFDDQYRVIRFVGSYENIFGKNRDGVLPEVPRFFRTSEFEYFRKKTKRLLETGEVQSFYSEIISKNELLLPVSVRLERISLGEGQKLVAANLNFYRQHPSDLEDYRDILLDNLPGMDIYLFDNQFRYVLAGGREKEGMGLRNVDFQGKTLFEMFEEKIQKRLFPFYRHALNGKATEGEVRIKGKIYYISSTPVFGMNHKVIGGAIISQDVTKEKEVEKNLINARKQAEEADKAKSLFLANMSHEIRTPLNAIIGFTELLGKTEASPKQKKFFRLISQSSGHLLSVVNEVLFLFKLGMGKVYMEKTPFNPREVIRSVHESLLFRAEEKSLAFDCRVGDEVPEYLTGDPFRLKQVLMNLAGNAIKFTDEGTVSIRMTGEKKSPKKVILRFDVEDTGMGIPEEDLKTVFEEFSQSYTGREKKRKGAGLGLTIVQKLVGLMEGRIEVESRVREGSRFTVFLPFKRSKGGRAIPAEKEFEGSSHLLEGKHILYADDDENNILLAESILKDWGVDVELAYNGIEAMRMIEEQSFDAILLDIHMPGRSGVEIIQKVKAEEGNPNFRTKMLAVTANVMEEDLHSYLDSGFDDYLLKPFKGETLYRKICSLLELGKASPVMNPEIIRKEVATDLPDEFYTTSLQKTSGNDHVFFNEMIDTFISGARETCDVFKGKAVPGNREQIKQKAHKAISSFRYFGLNQLADKLAQLENSVLHKQDDPSVEKRASQLAGEIEKILLLAEKAKIKGKGI